MAGGCDPGDTLGLAAPLVGHEQQIAATDDLVGTPAQHALGAAVPGEHRAVQPAADDQTVRSVEHGSQHLVQGCATAQPLVAPRQLALCRDAAVVEDGERLARDVVEVTGGSMASAGLRVQTALQVAHERNGRLAAQLVERLHGSHGAAAPSLVNRSAGGAGVASGWLCPACGEEYMTIWSEC